MRIEDGLEGELDGGTRGALLEACPDQESGSSVRSLRQDGGYVGVGL